MSELGPYERMTDAEKREFLRKLDVPEQPDPRDQTIAKLRSQLEATRNRRREQAWLGIEQKLAEAKREAAELRSLMPCGHPKACTAEAEHFLGEPHDAYCIICREIAGLRLDLRRLRDDYNGVQLNWRSSTENYCREIAGLRESVEWARIWIEAHRKQVVMSDEERATVLQQLALAKQRAEGK